MTTIHKSETIIRAQSTEPARSSLVAISTFEEEHMMSSRLRLLAGVTVGSVFVALTVSGVAGAGTSGWADHYGVVNATTRQFVFRGSVIEYSVSDARVTLVRRHAGLCHRTGWGLRESSGDALSVGVDCPEAIARHGALRLERGGTTLQVVRGGPDAPDRLRVRTGHGMRHDWPLLGRATHIDASYGIAIYVSLGNGLIAIRLRDGRQALIGMAPVGDRPRILGPGVVFRDNLRKRETRAGWTRLSFLPRAAVMRALDQSVGRLTTAPLAAVAADGPRVAFAVRNDSTGCNRVLFWNIVWNHVAPLTMANGPSCPLGGTADRITALGIGGSRAAWTMSSARGQTTVASSIIACVEMTVTGFRSRIGVPYVAGDGRTLAFAPNRRLRFPANRVAPGLGLTALAPAAGTHGIVVDAHRVAVLGDGRVDLQSSNGRTLGTFPAVGTRAIALRADRLLMLRGSRIDVFSVSRRTRLQSWPVPRATRSVDAQYGVAVLVAGRTVQALDLSTGTLRVLATAPVAPRAQIEPVGVIYHYNHGGHGQIRVITTATLERALRS